MQGTLALHLGGEGGREEGEMQAQVVKSTNLISCFKNQLELYVFFELKFWSHLILIELNLNECQ